MGLKVTIECDGLGALFTYHGVLTGYDAYAASKAIYSPKNLQTLRYQIADLRNVNRIELSTEDIKNLAETDRDAAKLAGGYIIASVVSHDLQESISRFYRAYAEDPAIQAKIFRSMDEARKWINQMLINKNPDTKVSA